MPFYSFLLTLGLVLLACNRKESAQQNVHRLISDSIISTKAPRMQDSKNEQDVDFKGERYHLTINRVAADSLPHVQTEADQWFIDNTITLRITCDNGVTIFCKTFTKKVFSSLALEDFFSHSVLEGMTFNKVTSKGLVFMASLCYPQTDLRMLFAVEIEPSGVMTISKEGQVELL